MANMAAPDTNVLDADAPPQAPRASLWRVVCATMAAPGEILRRHAAALPAPVALTVSGAAFAIFFAQTAIDLHRGAAWDQSAIVSAAVLAGTGGALGTVGVCLLAVLAFVLTRPFGGSATLGWSVRAFGLAYSPTLIYGICGLLAQLVLGWPAALAFGVTGFLWALSPLHATIAELAGGRMWPATILTTVIGGVLLAAWATLGLGGLR